MTSVMQGLSYAVGACLAVFTLYVALRAIQTLLENHSWAYKLEKLLRLTAILVGIVGTFGIVVFGCWLASHQVTLVGGHARYTGVSYHTQHRVFTTALIIGYSSIPLWLTAVVISSFRSITERNPRLDLGRALN